MQVVADRKSKGTGERSSSYATWLPPGGAGAAKLRSFAVVKSRSGTSPGVSQTEWFVSSQSQGAGRWSKSRSADRQAASPQQSGSSQSMAPSQSSSTKFPHTSVGVAAPQSVAHRQGFSPT